jgi:hypothetical protein
MEQPAEALVGQANFLKAVQFGPKTDVGRMQPLVFLLDVHQPQVMTPPAIDGAKYRIDALLHRRGELQNHFLDDGGFFPVPQMGRIEQEGRQDQADGQ